MDIIQEREREACICINTDMSGGVKEKDENAHGTELMIWRRVRERVGQVCGCMRVGA